MTLLTESPLIGPALALIGLTLVVLIYMYSKRIPAIIALGGIEGVQDAGGLSSLPPKAKNPADNYNHLFEMPVLFYVLMVVMTLTGTTGEVAVGLAWAYVVLRAVHSVIQCTSNNIGLRFPTFLLSTLVVIALWVMTAIDYFG